MRGKQIHTALTLLRLLRSEKTAIEIAGALGCSRRTAYRHIDAIGRAGIPIVRGERGWQIMGRNGL